MGDCFGEIALIMPNTRRTAAIRANNFVETQMLRRLDFEDCLAGYPQAHLISNALDDT
jgi:CRP-like cAMP-binding protein